MLELQASATMPGQAIIITIYFLRQSRTITQAIVQWRNLSSLQSPPPGSSDSCASSSQVTGTAAVCHRAWLIFVFLAEIGHVGQAGLELLASSDPPA